MHMTKRLHMSAPSSESAKPKRPHVPWLAFGLMVVSAVLLAHGGPEQPVIQLVARLAQQLDQTLTLLPR
jgi:hypothetical protein